MATLALMGDGVGAAHERERRVVRLLSALVALVAVLLVAVVLGGLLAWREYARLRAAVDPGQGDGAAGQLAAEVARRQRAASEQLAAVARDATRQIERFEARAERLRQQGGGALAEASRAVELTQLMADELLLQLKLMTTLESVLEKVARPLEVERAALEPPAGDERAPRGGQARTPRQGR